MKAAMFKVLSCCMKNYCMSNTTLIICDYPCIATDVKFLYRVRIILRSSAKIQRLVSTAWGFAVALQAPHFGFEGEASKDFGQNAIQMQENSVQFNTF